MQRQSLRIAMVIRLRPEKREEYLSLHADSNPGVRDLLRKYHMRNFSIFLRKLADGNEYLFGHYEYTGDDYDRDMANLAEEPRNVAWLAKCDPCQEPLSGESGWAMMDQIYFNE